MARSAPARLATVVAALGLAGAIAAHDARAASIVLNLSSDATLELILENGTHVRSASAPGTVIPPGTYLVRATNELPEFRDDVHLFHVTGPGVDLKTDPLASGGQPSSATFLPGSTYAFVDERSPWAGRVVFSTAGAGGAEGSSSGSSDGSSAASPAAAVTNLRGTLTGALLASGKVSLTFKGKPVSSLRSGRYRLVVRDATASRGLRLVGAGGKVVQLTGLRFVGRRTAVVTLRPGRWAFASPGSGKSSFRVVA